MSASIFEKTMAACLENKRVNNGRKAINESKKNKKLTESEELENPAEMDDIVDDVVVVVDPEVSEDDVTAAAQAAQDLIDGTPDGEIPSTDEHIGDFTYTCPICGNTFFNGSELHDGDECPVCGEFPSAFVLVGEVQEAEDEATAETDEVEAEPADGVPAEELIPEENDEELEPDVESVAPKKVQRQFKIDENTFNPFMNKFIRENYRNAKSFVVTAATLKGASLSLECVITFKSGKSKTVHMTAEGFNPSVKSLRFKDDGAFKTESKSAPFIFSVKVEKNVITCEGMKYNLVTKAVKEGKKVRISGNMIRESRRERERNPVKESVLSEDYSGKSAAEIIKRNALVAKDPYGDDISCFTAQDAYDILVEDGELDDYNRKLFTSIKKFLGKKLSDIYFIDDESQYPAGEDFAYDLGVELNKDATESHEYRVEYCKFMESEKYGKFVETGTPIGYGCIFA